tara:strand:- start:2421 stop:2717 length:297 start_codon:yes stop_codon:yes gene_type:complete
VPRDRYYADEEDIWHDGFRAGYRFALSQDHVSPVPRSGIRSVMNREMRGQKPKVKRKLSDWNKFVKANSKKKEFRYASGKVNLKKLGVAYRKKKRSRR